MSPSRGTLRWTIWLLLLCFLQGSCLATEVQSNSSNDTTAGSLDRTLSTDNQNATQTATKTTETRNEPVSGYKRLFYFGKFKDQSSNKPKTPPPVVKHIPQSKSANHKKERFNYASFDCGSLVLASNRGSSGASSILLNVKDKYMLNECSTKEKWVEIEFCEEILVDTIVLANYELFSSMFKEFRVYVNNRHPPSTKSPWRFIGQFTARNVRGKQVCTQSLKGSLLAQDSSRFLLQSFDIENPMIWAKYLRLEFLTHYGTEFYCPFSQLKIFGTTMMEEVKAEEEKPKTDKSDQTLNQASDRKEPLVSERVHATKDKDQTDGKEETTEFTVDLDFTTFELENSANCSMRDLYRNTFSRKIVAPIADFKNHSMETGDENEAVPKTSKRGTKSSKIIQESIFKNIIKRLNKLEESSASMSQFLEESRQELQEFMDFLQNEQYEVLLRFVERRWSDVIVNSF